MASSYVFMGHIKYCNKIIMRPKSVLVLKEGYSDNLENHNHSVVEL